MLFLLAGLMLFLGIHVVPMLSGLRSGLRGALSERGYMLAFTLVSALGLVLIVLGYAELQGRPRLNPDLWFPPRWTRHVTMLLMLPALILLVAAYVPSRIRTAAKHPMLAGVKLWAFAHLITNGDLASIVLFGRFLAWAVADRISVKRRQALGPLGAAKGGLSGDIIAVAGGLAAYAFMLLWGHRVLIGVPIIAGL